MNHPTQIELIGAALFALAIAHTFATGIFERLAHSRTRHAGVWHLLAEVEVVFGFWAIEGPAGLEDRLSARKSASMLHIFLAKRRLWA